MLLRSFGWTKQFVLERFDRTTSAAFHMTAMELVIIEITATLDFYGRNFLGSVNFPFDVNGLVLTIDQEFSAFVHGFHTNSASASNYSSRRVLAAFLNAFVKLLSSE
jgi:hypothetical protein